MRNITFSAEEESIELARAFARSKNTTLNELFRDWLASIARMQQAERAVGVMEQISTYASSEGRKFTRDEMNERR